jgi:hypothetical protein
MVCPSLAKISGNFDVAPQTRAGEKETVDNTRPWTKAPGPTTVRINVGKRPVGKKNSGSFPCFEKSFIGPLRHAPLKTLLTT